MSSHPLNAPYQSVATRDGWINIGAANQANWLLMLQAISAQNLADDPRFKNNADRMQNLDVLMATLSEVFKTNTTEYWLACLTDAGVPAGPILDVCEMHQDPQALAREMVTEVKHPTAGGVKTLGAPVKFHDTPGGVKRAAPLLGEHTFEVLMEAGYEREAIDQLVAKGIVGIVDDS